MSTLFCAHFCTWTANTKYESAMVKTCSGKICNERWMMRMSRCKLNPIYLGKMLNDFLVDFLPHWYNHIHHLTNLGSCFRPYDSIFAIAQGTQQYKPFLGLLNRNVVKKKARSWHFSSTLFYSHSFLFSSSAFILNSNEYALCIEVNTSTSVFRSIFIKMAFNAHIVKVKKNNINPFHGGRNSIQ